MNSFISIHHPTKKLNGTIALPGSKSESNRVFILDALSHKQSTLFNLSTAEDTRILKEALLSNEEEINIKNAGTAMRFLTAYYTARKQNKIVSGDARMLERPIKPLVEALIQMGANIEYLGKEGFPPIKINGSLSTLNIKEIQIPANISSQFISAILMIAPTLPEGIILKMEGKIASIPYIQMTLQIMEAFGIKSTFKKNTITIRPQNYLPTIYHVESDWSSASYWYSMLALSDDSSAIFLEGLKRKSMQGDAIIKEIFEPFGIITEHSDNGIFITKTQADLSGIPDYYDFTDYPDLAQTIIVLCAALGIKCGFTGLESLKIKETDRVQALQNELKKFNVQLIEESEGIYVLKGKFKPTSTIIETYEDHRMAMAFAPYALICDEIKIENPDCVKKSYPGFFNDLEQVGFLVKEERREND